MVKRRSNKWLVTVGTLLGVGIMKYFSLPCPFQRLWHVPCPGCGMTRALQSGLRFKWQEAYKYHPLFWLVPIMLVIWLMEPKSVWQKHLFWGIVVSLFVVVYIGRVIM